MSLTWPKASGWTSVLVFSVACVVAAGCTGGDRPEVARQSSALSGHDDNGTDLFAGTATVVSQTCNGGTGSVTIGGTLTTSGSVDSAEVTASVNGGDATLVSVIVPEDFAHDGREKTASYSITIDGLSNGTNSVEVCFDQSGSQGREPKHTCAEVVIVVVDCSSCRGVGFFGDLVGNPSLCTGNGPPHVPVHVKGDLGDAPALTITGPNGYVHHAAMEHAGESCVYQYNWDTAGNGGDGEYAFAVTGGGSTHSFTATLRCRSSREAISSPWLK